MPAKVDISGRVKGSHGLMAVLSSLSYSFCSVSMVMSNKASVVSPIL